MKNLKRVAWFFVARRIQKEKQEHQIILSLLRSNEDIMKIEDPGKTGIKYIKHPKSKKLSANGKIRWDAQIDDVMMIQLDDSQSMVPSDKDKQFRYYFHEMGHLKNKDDGHFRKRKACGCTIFSCLLRELQAEINILDSQKKIKEEPKALSWLEGLDGIRRQCKDCLEMIDKGKCPEKEMKSMEECFNIIDQAVKIKSRKIIFEGRKK